MRQKLSPTNVFCDIYYQPFTCVTLGKFNASFRFLLNTCTRDVVPSKSCGFGIATHFCRCVIATYTDICTIKKLLKL